MYIHTPTKEEYDRLMKFLEEKGYKWSTGPNPTEKDNFSTMLPEKIIFTSGKSMQHDYGLEDQGMPYISVDEAIRQLGGTTIKYLTYEEMVDYVQRNGIIKALIDWNKYDNGSKSNVETSAYIGLRIPGKCLSTFDSDTGKKNMGLLNFNYGAVHFEELYNGLFGIEVTETASTPETPKFKVGDRVQFVGKEEIERMGLSKNNELLSLSGKIYTVRSIIDNNGAISLVEWRPDLYYNRDLLIPAKPDNQNIESSKSMYDQVVDILKSGKYALMVDKNWNKICIGSKIKNGGDIAGSMYVYLEDLNRGLDYQTDYNLRYDTEDFCNEQYGKVIPLEPRQYTSADADYIKSLIDGNPEPEKEIRVAGMKVVVDKGLGKDEAIITTIGNNGIGSEYQKIIAEQVDRAFGDVKPMSDEYFEMIYQLSKSNPINPKNQIFPPLNPLEKPTMTTQNNLQADIASKYFKNEDVQDQTVEVTEQLKGQSDAIQQLKDDVENKLSKINQLIKDLEDAYNRGDVETHKKLLKKAQDLGAILVKSEYLNLGAKLNKDEPEQTAEEYLNS